MAPLALVLNTPVKPDTPSFSPLVEPPLTLTLSEPPEKLAESVSTSLIWLVPLSAGAVTLGPASPLKAMRRPRLCRSSSKVRGLVDKVKVGGRLGPLTGGTAPSLGP